MGPIIAARSASQTSTGVRSQDLRRAGRWYAATARKSEAILTRPVPDAAAEVTALISSAKPGSGSFCIGVWTAAMEVIDASPDF
jgi:hypothetical protein